MKTFNGENLDNILTIETKSDIVNESSRFLPPLLGTLTQSEDASRSTHIRKNHNDTYQDFI